MMNKKIFGFVFVMVLLTSMATQAQMRRGGMRVFIGGRPRMGRGHNRNVARQALPKFDPYVNILLGYGFPNLDKNYLLEFNGLFRGNTSQTGLYIGSADYRFSRNMGIGVLVTHGTVSVPYYDAFNTNIFTGKLDNWSFMLNLMRYLPAGKKVTPYFRTAIGVNSWKQDYTDLSGNKVPVINTDIGDLAYQVGFGATFHVSKHAGLYAEAGYGKYILAGGLAFKF